MTGRPATSPPRSPAAPHRRDYGALVVAWGLVVLGALVLIVDYGSIPETVVLYRPPWADSVVGPKSVLTVGRMVLMGVGQLGAATAMALASQGASRWQRFWSWLGLVAGGKTLLECVSLLAARGSSAEQALTFATLALVGLFTLLTVWWWRRGALAAHPSLTGGTRTGLLASLALWSLSALAPRWFA